MARARNIKPGFFANDQLAEIEPLGRLLFIGLWTIADREGRLEDRPLRIKVLILPYDKCDADKLLQDLHRLGFIVRYSIEEANYIQIINFVKHQNPHHKEIVSVIPPPLGHKLKGSNQDTTTKEQRQCIFDRDNHRCVFCGTQHNLTIDHKIPLSKGGSSEDDNLQTLCKNCNSSKKDSIITQSSSKLDSSLITQASINPADSLNLIPDSLNLDPLDKVELALDPAPEKIPYTEIIAHLNETCGTNYKASGEKTKGHIQARWNDGFRVDDFKRVITNKARDWLNDNEWSKFLRPSTLFGTKFEEYLNQRGGQTNGQSAGNQPDIDPDRAKWDNYDPGKEYWTDDDGGPDPVIRGPDV